MSILICAKRCGERVSFTVGGSGTGDYWPHHCGEPMIHENASVTQECVTPPTPKKCHNEDCTDDATHTVYWPGKNPPPRYCLIDALKAKIILAACGTPVVVEPPIGDEDDYDPSIADM
jgi:hypothetical protein